MSRREWKKNQVDRATFNDQVYALLNADLAKFKTNPPHDRYNDVRLVPREILDNIYKHNQRAFIIGLEVTEKPNSHVHIRIYHDGDEFQPFEPKNGCTLLLQLNYEYKFDTRFVATDSGRFSITLNFDLSMIIGGN